MEELALQVIHLIPNIRFHFKGCFKGFTVIKYTFVACFNPQGVRCFLKFLKKRSQFRCTGLLRSGKLVHLDGKNLNCFIQNLVHDLMNLVLRSKGDRK